LGRYVLIEDVPFGFVTEENQYPITLGFDGVVTDIITKTVSIHNQRQKARVSFQKTMEVPEGAGDDYNPYANVVFGLYTKDDVQAMSGEVLIPSGSLLEVIRVGANGKGFIMTDLPHGSYYLAEISTSAGYALPEDTVYDFAFEYDPDAGPVVEIVLNDGEPIENTLMRGSLRVSKTFEGKDVPVTGIRFNVVGVSTAGIEYVGEHQTDENGVILIEGLPVGTYFVTELASDLTVGYVLSETQTAVVAADELTEITIQNRLIRGSVRLKKVDSVTGNGLPGAEFELFGSGDNIIGVFETDKKGEIIVDNLPFGFGYKWVETKSPAGYMISNGEIFFSINEDGTTVTLTANNDKLPHPTDSPTTEPPSTTFQPCTTVPPRTTEPLATTKPPCATEPPCTIKPPCTTQPPKTTSPETTPSPDITPTLTLSQTPEPATPTNTPRQPIRPTTPNTTPPPTEAQTPQPTATPTPTPPSIARRPPDPNGPAPLTGDGYSAWPFVALLIGSAGVIAVIVIQKRNRDRGA